MSLSVRNKHKPQKHERPLLSRKAKQGVRPTKCVPSNTRSVPRRSLLEGVRATPPSRSREGSSTCAGEAGTGVLQATSQTPCSEASHRGFLRSVKRSGRGLAQERSPEPVADKAGLFRKKKSAPAVREGRRVAPSVPQGGFKASRFWTKKRLATKGKRRSDKTPVPASPFFLEFSSC